MSGIHQFTSSQWIQSGSEAQFKTGINVTGSISATGTITAGTFVGDGSQLTGIGSEDFFAGNPTEISDGTPSSKDTAFALTAGTNTASANQVVIATTHSANFTPNYYSFYKLTDQGFETIQSGSLSYYSGSDKTGNDINGTDPFDNDLAPGVHRYMVNAVNTGSGVGHSLFTTITIASFVNRPPELSTPTNLTFQIPHNSNQGSITFELTESSDPDTNVGDFIRRFEATRSGVNPSSGHTYNLAISQPGQSGQTIATQSHEIAATPATPLSNAGLTFTASISSYNVLNGNLAELNQADRSETFNVKIYDSNLERNTDSGSFNLTVQAPPTASIFIRTEVENGSYTNTITNDYTTTMLYDRGTVPTSKTGLDAIYTSSLVRIRTCADIISPSGFTPSSGIKTRAKIFNANNSVTDKDDTFVHWVEIDGYNGTTYTASRFSTTEGHFTNYSAATTPTESNGWINLALPVTLGRHFGPIHNDADLLDVTEGIRYGSYNHFSASSVGNAPEITVNAIPNVEINSIKVQIESSSFSGVPSYSRTGSILYGHTGTLLVENTSSLLGKTKSIQYISESVIRYRVLAKITEPFGPDHKTTRVDIRKDGSPIHQLQFNTSSEHHISNALNGSQKRVAHYTSSWQSSSFGSGTFALSASFTSSASNAGQSVTTGTYANLLINQTESIQVNNVKVQVESSSFSQIPVYSRTGSLLYGHDQTLLQEQTASLLGLDRSAQYISESVIRYRVLAKVQEPFGPYNEKTLVTLTGGSTSHNIDFDTPDTESFDTSHRRISHYTSSWNSSSFIDGTHAFTASFATHSLAADLIAAQGQYSSLLISNTASTQIDNIEVELETAYGTEVATHERTSRILYGFTSSLKSTETASLLNYTKTSEYISESVIRYRVRAKVVEPFGPETTDIVSSIVIGGSGGGGSIHEYLAVESFANSSNIGTGASNYRNVGAEDWTQDTSGTPSTGTGPNNGISSTSTASNSEAQSSGQGYIFTEGTNNTNKVFTLRTPQLNLDQSTTNEKLVFYFHIKGSNISSEPLEIYHGTSATSIGSTELSYTYYNGSSTVSGPITAQTHANQGDAFYRLECDISAYRSTGNFYLYIKSLNGGGFSSDVAIDNVHVIGTTGGGGSTETLTFTTASSADIATTGSEAYTADHQRILNYTSSWQEYNFDNNINLSSSFSTTENVLTVGTGVTSSLTIVPTVAPIIHSTMSYEAKWTNETPSDTDTTSRSARILYGYSDTFLSAETASQLTNQQNYKVTHSTDAVIRHRIRAKVVEPFGPHTTTFTVAPDHKLSDITLSTASANTDVYATSSDYETSTDKFIIHYTSSWFEKNYTAASYTQNYSISSTPTAESTESASPTLTVTAPENSTIDIITQVEQTESGSNQGGLSRTSTYIHGRELKTITNPSDQSSFTELAKKQMVRARVLAHIQEPFGPRVSVMDTSLTGIDNSVAVPINSASGINHSETNGAFSYEFTSAFTPIELNGISEKTINSNTPSPTYGTLTTTKISSSVTMLARQTSSIDFVSLVASSDFSSSTGVTITHPYFVPGDNSSVTNLGITATTTHTPPPISIYSSLSDAQSSVTYTVTSITFAGKASTNTDSGGRNGHVDFTSIDAYTGPQSITVTGTVTADGSITGDTTSDTNTVTVICLPQPPKSLEGQYFAAFDASAHDDDNSSFVDLKNGRLFEGLLPSSSAWTYSGSQSPGDSISNVFIVNDTNGTNTDYSIELNLLNNTFGQGDKGRLIVKLNGVETASFDLTGSFNTPNGNFTPSTTIGSSANSTLFISSWKGTGGFSFYDGTEFFPYGYRGLNGVFNLDYKVRNGYNYLQIIKTSGSVSESMVPFEWYYDEYKPTDFNNAPVSWSWAPYNGSDPTMSLSGVSYFKDNVDFEISYSGAIINLANDTYQSVSDLGTVNPDSNLQIFENGSPSDTTKPIDPGDTLFWSSHDATDTSIPEIGATASLAYRAKYTGTSTSEVTRSADIDIDKRNLASATGTANVSQTASVGRFVNDSTIGSNSDTNEVAYFYEETKRIPSSSNLNTLLEASKADYEYWLTQSDYVYDSTQSLTTNSELQQTIAGHLIYPTANYTGSNIFNPNAPDYTSATGDRYWYRAIKVQGISGVGDKVLKVKIGVDSTDPITQADIYAHNPSNAGPVGFDTLPIRIRCKMPGPINADGGQDGAGTGDVGSNWSAICGGLSLPSNASVENWFISDSTQFIPESTENGFISLIWDCGSYAIRRNNDVCIIEVRMKASATQTRHHIKSIEILDV